METPEFIEAATYFEPEKRLSDGDNFIDVDDLLDFPADDAAGGGTAAAGIEAAMTGLSTDSSTSSAALDNFHAADNGGGPRGVAGDAQFSNDLAVPYDDLAELEWLSNFVEESFSSEDLQKLQLIQGMKAARTHEISGSGSGSHHLYQFQPEPARQGPPMFNSELPVPAKARSKRSRAAPGNWTSRLLAVSPNPSSTGAAAISSSSGDSDAAAAGKCKTVKAAVQKTKKEAAAPENSGSGEGRKCLHCATDKTPQWRTGPMGPKTLCNACGVRYKSGRLVPEYRPAASPTFVLTKHSNSHRKVLELRRQKEMLRAQQQQQQFLHHHHHHHQNMMFDMAANGGGDDYLIHQHIGPDFRQLI
ncbi:GATA transcription factor 12 [Andrographis paniculata]|uniref:GATA transcription factor 12 n=1 Tax=Andrographis paniculata TaxID=175694 RepID=UPI0021E90CA9|nr:GATA transcription factor 12 [Andrographis paniculata]